MKKNENKKIKTKKQISEMKKKPKWKNGKKYSTENFTEYFSLNRRAPQLMNLLLEVLREIRVRIKW